MNPMFFLGICIVISAIIVSVPFIMKAESKRESDGLAAQTQQVREICDMFFGKTYKAADAEVKAVDSLLVKAKEQGRDPSICRECMASNGVLCKRIIDNRLGCGKQPYTDCRSFAGSKDEIPAKNGFSFDDDLKKDWSIG